MQRIGNTRLPMVTVLAVVFTALLITAVSCRQFGGEEGTSGNGGGVTTDVTVVGDITLQDKDGNPIDNSYLADPTEDLVIYPKDENGDTITDEDLAWVWRPDGGSSDGSDDITLTPNEDGSITIPGSTVGDGTIIVTDPEGGADGSDAIQEFPIETKSRAITISGPKMVDIDFAGSLYASSPTGVYGEYDKIELTATSTGEAVVDLTNATWSWQAIDTDAKVSKESSDNDTAIYKGVKPGTIEVTVEVADGTKASYEVEVVESTFITFDLSGVTAETNGTYRLELPLVSATGWGIYYEDWEYEVDWGDGTAGSPNVNTYAAEDYDRETNSYPEHYYSDNSAEKTIRIVNRDVAIGLQAWSFVYASTDRAGGNYTWGSRPFTAYGADELIDVERYGSGKMGSGMFGFCENIVSLSAAGSPQLGEYMSSMFMYAKGFNQDISGWDVSGVKDMNSMFVGAEAYNNGLDPGVGGTLDWGDKTGLVENMGNMFYNAKAFNQDISGWDVRGVKYMRGMFEGAEEYNNGLDPGVGGTLDWGLKTGLVENMSNMFYNAKAFNQDISGWDVRGVKDMSYMFREAKGFNQDLSGWDVSGVKDMRYMFYRAEAYNNGDAALDWGAKTGLVEYMSNMFYEAKGFNQDVSGWDVRGVKYMNGMFWGAKGFNQDVSEWDVSSVTDMSRMFYGAEAYTNKGAKLAWSLSAEVKAKNDYYSDSSYWDYPGYDVSSMYNMFGGVSPLGSDLSKHPDGCKCDISLHKL